MFSFLKSIFKRAPEASPPAAPPKPPPPKPVEPPPAPAAPPVKLEGAVGVPVKSIIEMLPAELKSRIALSPKGDEIAAIPPSGLVGQLHTGSVKVKFGQLKTWLPHGTFSPAKDADETLVGLPLAPFVSHFLKVRTQTKQQKKYQVSGEIADLFDSKGRPVAKDTVSNKARVDSGASAPTAGEPVAPAAPEPVRPSPPPAPEPVVESVPIKMPRPPGASTPAVAAVPLRPSVEAAVPPPPPKPVEPAPIRMAPPSPPPAPVAPPPAPDQLTLPMSAFFASLPAEARSGLTAVQTANVRLPMAEVEAALKQGKAVFPWQRFSSWIDPKAADAGRWFADDTPIEIPLPVLIPLFMGLRKPTPARKKYAWGEGLPDVFHVPKIPAKEPEPVEPPAAAPIAPAPLAEPARRPEAASTPADIARQAVQTPGVVGAFIATGDGLPLADQLSANHKADVLSAFVPSLFQRVDQLNRELGLQPLTHFTVQMENLSLHVIKTGPLFLGALSEPAEALDWPALKAIATRLKPEP